MRISTRFKSHLPAAHPTSYQSHIRLRDSVCPSWVISQLDVLRNSLLSLDHPGAQRAAGLRSVPSDFSLVRHLTPPTWPHCCYSIESQLMDNPNSLIFLKSDFDHRTLMDQREGSLTQCLTLGNPTSSLPFVCHVATFAARSPHSYFLHDTESPLHSWGVMLLEN